MSKTLLPYMKKKFPNRNNAFWKTLCIVSLKPYKYTYNGIIVSFYVGNYSKSMF